jgi:hypothetical protein
LKLKEVPRPRAAGIEGEVAEAVVQAVAAVLAVVARNWHSRFFASMAIPANFFGNKP